MSEAKEATAATSEPKSALWLLLGGALCCALLLIVSLVVWVLLLGGADDVASYLFRHRHAPSDIEVAPTVVSYPSGPDVAAIVGGKGQGLDCSIPWPVGPLLFPRPQGSTQAPVELQFRQACVFHDMCYRHGLATYGYSQADCDALLQEHASRICKQIFASRSWQWCHARARKVLLGVTLGGPDSFQGYWTSTFHEFDPIPNKSREFNVARLVRGDVGPDPAINDRTRLITLHVQPSGVAIFEPGKSKREEMTELRRGWIHAAPFVHAGADARDALHWYLRSRERNTAVLFAAGTVEDIRGNRFKETDTDILASSPIFVPRSSWSEPVLGLTRQRTGRFEICGVDSASSAPDHHRCTSIAPFHDVRSNATYLADNDNKRQAVKNLYRIFQSAPLVTNDHLIVLKRNAAEDGENYRNVTDAFVFDLAKLGGTNAPGEIVTRVIPDLPIRERDEPLAALPDGTKSPVLLSVVVEPNSSTVSLYEFDLAAGERRAATISNAGKPLALESSWIERPVLLLKPSETETGAGKADSRLVFARTQFAAAESKGDDDQVNLDILVLGRSDRAWRTEVAGHCKVAYTKRQRDVGAKPCLLAALDSDGNRVVEASTAVTRLLGAQLLASYPSTAQGLTIAIPDQCFPGSPIVLDARLDVRNPVAPRNLTPRSGEAEGLAGSKRIISCNQNPPDAESAPVRGSAK